MNSKLQQVINILKKEGYGQEQTQKFTEDIIKLASAKFYSEMLANLTDQDMAEINKCTSQEEANIEIRTRFAKNSGQNPDLLMQQMITNFSQGFLDQYHQDKKKKQP